MRKLIAHLALLFLSIVFGFMGCDKNPSTESDGFYFNCKIDGQDYAPDNCANCKVAKLLGDTTLIINGNNGFTTVVIGVIRLDHVAISPGEYPLDQRLNQKAFYKNSTTISDRFDTDTLRVGRLNINKLETDKKIVEGAFSFDAYNAVQDKIVHITVGTFRLNYVTD